ncbi:MAG: trypsin-like peptidase domain-containing protein [Parcubacteria group bacterium]|nr:trypsin-like peptidase domain-containing protein [Parcubacteria group bacterium]
MEKSPIVAIAKKVCPAVVNIVISKDMPKVSGFYTMPYGGQEVIVPKFDKNSIQKVKIGGGSGFVVSADGIVLTNAHVVADPKAEYTIILDHGEDAKLPIEVLARDPIHDIAILKIKPKGKKKKEFPYIELGDSAKLELGEEVVAVGYALGEFRNTVSTGIVSGLSRFIQAQTGVAAQAAERLRGLIQTDAAINPGNSGGPLVDMEGRVVGINTAVVFGAQSIGFAIPINSAKQDLEELREHGRIRQPFFGVRHLIIDEMMQKQNKLPVDHGALIMRQTYGEEAVARGSAAEAAGLKEFDIILECEGTKITPENTLQDVVSKHEIGDKIPCKVLRGGKEVVLNVTLEEKKVGFADENVTEDGEDIGMMFPGGVEGIPPPGMNGMPPGMEGTPLPPELRM